MQNNRQKVRSFHTVNKVIACILSLVFVLVACAVPVYAEEEQIQTTPSRIPLTELEDTIDSYVATNQKNTAAVSIVAIKNGETIFNKAYGYADIEQQRKADSSTVFEWGSVTKLLVWTSVMQLVEQGKLDLDTDIKEYLPKGFLKKLEYDAPITLLDLMNHQAGWEDKMIDLWYLSENQVMDLGETLQKFEPKQIYEPRSVLAYSNYGVAMAAYIVEVQSGQPFYEYVNEHIFKPLDMKETTIHPSHQDRPDLMLRRDQVQGYTANVELIPKTKVYMNIYPAGGAMGTAEDAAKFLAALMPINHGHLLFKNKETLKEMLSTSLYYDGTSIPRIAHGFIEVEYWTPALEHGGNTLGFSNKLVFDPKSNFGLVVMTNQFEEEVYCFGLVQKLFGNNYRTSTVTSGNDGYYLTTRRSGSGFTKFYAYLLMEKYSTFELSNFTNVVEKDGIVEKVSFTYNDYVRVKSSTLLLIIATFIALAVATVFNLRAIIGYMFRLSKYKSKKWERPGTGFDKYHVAINVAGLAFVLNNAVLYMRAVSLDSSYSSLRIHLIFNLIYVILALAYLVLLIYKLWKISYSKKRKAVYIMSGVSALLFAAFIVGWELYF
ncbi:serine hydrolase domain-containing protein [Paenibacillus xylanilyticus]|uniref:Serine hydrolase n=1 Tax=Paenibacillus xylanilyticus TaxID=248903 RepID=A0A7Y6C2B3_9BACL|nr:serine hydrolase domain-containing protein [Paenibacillus xylanilyticus]NUU78798.1 serine hydrolase [Paenibacillus xylanilyticus]